MSEWGDTQSAVPGESGSDAEPPLYGCCGLLSGLIRWYFCSQLPRFSPALWPEHCWTPVQTFLSQEEPTVISTGLSSALSEIFSSHNLSFGVTV